MLTATPAEQTAGQDATAVTPAAGGPASLRWWRESAAHPVPAGSVAVFRIAFGVLVSFSAVRFLARGWVTTFYTEPNHHLTYPGFDWIQPLPAPWMHLHVMAIAVLGANIAIGYRHRLSTGLFIVAFGYTELIEASLYLNHYWFLTVTAALLLLLPVNHYWSLDARQGRVPTSDIVPAFVVWALRAQLAAVYMFAGIAKLNADWLVRAQPLQLWLADRTDTPIVGFVLDEPVAAFVASWTAAAFDLTIVGWLLYRPTRRFAYAALVVFHLATGALFQIGVFPLVMIVASLVFFEPDWPNRLLARFCEPAAPGRPPTDAGAGAPPIRRSAAVALALFATAQLALPLRHYAYPSDVRWSEEGYYLSWRVMLTDKAGHVIYNVTDPSTGETWEVGPDLVLADWQEVHASTRPDLIHATADLIARHYRRSGIEGVEVRADAWVSINGERARQLVDPTVDLAQQSRGFGSSPWLRPLNRTDG
ncbi:MAG: HTTM domain-containing protein [Acidimicrobiales bacterium]